MVHWFTVGTAKMELVVYYVVQNVLNCVTCLWVWRHNDWQLCDVSVSVTSQWFTAVWRVQPVWRHSDWRLCDVSVMLTFRWYYVILTSLLDTCSQLSCTQGWKKSWFFQKNRKYRKNRIFSIYIRFFRYLSNAYLNSIIWYLAWL